MKTLPLMAVMSVTLLSGCDRAPNARDICNDTPALCTDLNTSGWCRHNRAAVIHARYQFQSTADDAHRFNEIVELEQYVECMSNIAQMVSRTPGKSIEQERSLFYLKGLESLESLQKATSKASHPGLSLYHWTRFNDTDALERFLSAESKDQIEGLLLKRLTGIYFTKSNPEKAKRYLLDVVEANPQAARLDQELLTQLGFVMNELGEHQAAFLFTYLGQRNNNLASPTALAQHLGLPTQQTEALVQRADEMANAMRDGEPIRERFNL
ncbi:DUF2989 domain-containing protein [Ferrimonas balearica]|uniref:DUF2989 domain-containing protein n=1 Tax=Ferrimonas balearica TaxID=44012 RepID=UPI001C9A1B17|nr:DUF2989 domain-containing protein [Ferrimonas balearica]MBY5920348.1 DUF2989 domain-containing protein [Ferrimonas balearica]MBY5996967.1 DUF2989 domain-containing protein [Ferrimonas balearica]